MLPSDSERLDELENGQSQLGYLTRGKVETGVIPQMVTYPFNSNIKWTNYLKELGGILSCLVCCHIIIQ